LGLLQPKTTKNLKRGFTKRSCKDRSEKEMKLGNERVRELEDKEGIP
jgi:hypothetical protein